MRESTEHTASDLSGARRRSYGGFERVELVGLVLQQAREDLFEASVPVAEPESAFWWDRVELAICEISDLPDALARS
jgi:hypothetical protein